MEYLKVPELNKKKLLKLLTGELPGEEAHLKMAPEFRGNFIFRESPRQAAVMILLFPYKNELHTLFINGLPFALAVAATNRIRHCFEPGG